MHSATNSQTEIAAVVRAVVRLSRRLRGQRPPGSVSLSALGVLATLHRLGPLSAVGLAAAEHLKPQSLTRVMAALDRDGLIARRRGSADRREWIIEITRLGRSALAQDMGARRAWLAATMSLELSTAEQRRLIDAAALMMRLAEHGSVSRPDTIGAGRSANQRLGVPSASQTDHAGRRRTR